LLAGALLSFALFRQVPEVVEGKKMSKTSFGWRDVSISRLRVLGILQLIAIVRAFVITGIGTFLPVYMNQKGMPLFWAGATGTLFLGIGSLGGLLGGHLGDNLNRNRFMQVPLLLAVPMLLGFFYFEGVIRFFCLALGGMALYVSLPLNVVLAVELFPGNAGTMAALMIGFSWGVGGLLLTPFGVVATTIGLETTMIALTLLLLIAAGAAFLLPKAEQDNRLSVAQA
jgi:FSR family fosmidomycin resistance protein-like MFS transporter